MFTYTYASKRNSKRQQVSKYRLIPFAKSFGKHVDARENPVLANGLKCLQENLVRLSS